MTTPTFFDVMYMSRGNLTEAPPSITDKNHALIVTQNECCTHSAVTKLSNVLLYFAKILLAQTTQLSPLNNHVLLQFLLRITLLIRLIFILAKMVSGNEKMLLSQTKS